MQSGEAAELTGICTSYDPDRDDFPSFHRNETIKAELFYRIYMDRLSDCISGSMVFDLFYTCNNDNGKDQRPWIQLRRDSIFLSVHDGISSIMPWCRM